MALDVLSLLTKGVATTCWVTFVRSDKETPRQLHSYMCNEKGVMQ